MELCRLNTRLHLILALCGLLLLPVALQRASADIGLIGAILTFWEPPENEDYLVNQPIHFKSYHAAAFRRLPPTTGTDTLVVKMKNGYTLGGQYEVTSAQTDHVWLPNNTEDWDMGAFTLEKDAYISVAGEVVVWAKTIWKRNNGPDETLQYTSHRINVIDP